MDAIEFILNGRHMRLEGAPPTRSLLDWLREDQGLCGTKEGCNEGDCGACTVMITTLSGDSVNHRALNACILFLPQLQGKAVRTVEGLSGPRGELHPVQQAMIDHHGSQCGFCTPGFVMSLATALRNGENDYDRVLAGNLCRCTGYAPIIRAAKAAAAEKPPSWIENETAQLKAIAKGEDTSIKGAYIPADLDGFANWYLKNPDAQIIGGATDIGLWVTKHMIELPSVCFISQLKELQQIEIRDGAINIGAAVTLTALGTFMEDHHKDFSEMIRRYGSTQVRNAATIGGNIANGSPIGDGPPALIALGASLHLRRGSETRTILLEDYFVEYGKQDRQRGEFVAGVSVPLQDDNLKCYKISKRFDQDISALCGCFNITVENNTVKDARIAFGGMAAISKRAAAVEAALVGQPWQSGTIKKATSEFAKDFNPISDMRASDTYRMQAARNLLVRYFTETEAGMKSTSVLEVSL